MPSAPALELRLNRSARQRRIVHGGYLLACAAWLAAGLHWLAVAVGLVVLAMAWWRDRAAPWPRVLSFRSGAGIRVTDSCGSTRTAPGLSAARTGRHVTSIAWGRGRRNRLALFDDAFRDAGHKRLRCLLRHSDTVPPC